MTRPPGPAILAAGVSRLKGRTWTGNFTLCASGARARFRRLGALDCKSSSKHIAMGIGALCAVMLRLPLTSVLLATLLLSSDGLQVMPLAIVAVVVA
jgi:hypothetical protein